MKRKIENISETNLENNLPLLKKKLLTKEIDFIRVRDILLFRDQKDPARDLCEENLQFLKNPEIEEFIEKNEEYLDTYDRFLSVTEFHVGQRLAIKNNPTAIDHFEQALKLSKSESWSSYIKGTILYMKGLEIPVELITGVKEEQNAKILQNFNKGLKNRGCQSYTDDYFN